MTQAAICCCRAYCTGKRRRRWGLMLGEARAHTHKFQFQQKTRRKSEGEQMRAKAKDKEEEATDRRNKRDDREG